MVGNGTRLLGGAQMNRITAAFVTLLGMSALAACGSDSSEPAGQTSAYGDVSPNPDATYSSAREMFTIIDPDCAPKSDEDSESLTMITCGGEALMSDLTVISFKTAEAEEYGQRAIVASIHEGAPVFAERGYPFLIHGDKWMAIALGEELANDVHAKLGGTMEPMDVSGQGAINEFFGNPPASLNPNAGN